MKALAPVLLSMAMMVGCSSVPDKLDEGECITKAISDVEMIECSESQLQTSSIRLSDNLDELYRAVPERAARHIEVSHAAWMSYADRYCAALHGGGVTPVLRIELNFCHRELNLRRSAVYREYISKAADK